MVVLAWLTTLLFSSPQAVIFRVMKHPQADFYQCTTWNFFEGFASNVTEGNTTRLLLPGGMTPTQAADLYHTLFNCEVRFWEFKVKWKYYLEMQILISFNLRIRISLGAKFKIEMKTPFYNVFLDDVLIKVINWKLPFFSQFINLKMRKKYNIIKGISISGILCTSDCHHCKLFKDFLCHIKVCQNILSKLSRLD